MMPGAPMNFSSCWLLMVLMLTSNWRSSTGHPVRASPHPLATLSRDGCAECSSLFKNLLVNLTQLLKSDDICFGITSDAVSMHSKAETLQACAPTMNSTGCMMRPHSSFSETECLKNIMKDLAHYHDAIQSYLEHPLRSPHNETKLLRPTLEIIKILMEKCSPSGQTGSSERAAPLWGDNSFDNRQEMCKMMKGFYVRTITINRAMGYISSGHRK